MRVGAKVLRGLLFLCLLVGMLAIGGSAYAADEPTMVFTPDYKIDDGGNSYSTVVGTKVEMSAQDGGTQWTHSGNSTGITGPTLTINSLKVSDQGTYNSGGGGGDSTLKVYNQVAFSPQPVTGTYPNDQDVMLETAIDTNTGVAGHTYEGYWEENINGTWTEVPNSRFGTFGTPGGGVLAGTTVSVTIPQADLVGGRQYRCYAIDDTETFSSSGTLLSPFFKGYSYPATIILQAPPTITTQPKDVTVTPGGSNVSMSVAFTPPAGYNANHYTFQWFRKDYPNPGNDEQLTDALVSYNGYKASGTQTKTLTFTVPFDDKAYMLYGGTYYCVITDKNYPTLQTTSQTAAVKVNIAATPTSNTAITIPTGGTATFKIAACGGKLPPTGAVDPNTTLTYTWQQYVNGTWVDDTGTYGTWSNDADRKTFVTSSITVPAGTLLRFRCKITDNESPSKNTGYTAEFQVTVTDSLTVSPMSIEWNSLNITNNLSYQYIQVGTELTFTATAQSRIAGTPAWSWNLYRATSATDQNPVLLNVTPTLNNTPGTPISTSVATFKYTLDATDDMGQHYYFLRVSDGSANTANTARVARIGAPPILKPTVKTNPAANPDIVIAAGGSLTLSAIRNGGTGQERIFWYEQPNTGGPINLGQSDAMTKQNVGAADYDATFFCQVEPLNDTFTGGDVVGSPLRAESDPTAQLKVGIAASMTPAESYVEVHIDEVTLSQSTLTAVLPVVANAAGGTGNYSYTWTLTPKSNSVAGSKPLSHPDVANTTQAYDSYTPANSDSDMYSLIEWQTLLNEADPVKGIEFTVTCVVADVGPGGGDSVTVSAKIYLVANLSAMVLDASPNKTIYRGESSDFSVTGVSGTQRYTQFDWVIQYGGSTYHVKNGESTSIQGGTFTAGAAGAPDYPPSDQLKITGTGSMTLGDYLITCNVSDSSNGAPATSSQMKLTVKDATTIPFTVAIAASPSSTVKPGTDVTITSTTTGGSGDPRYWSYTWYTKAPGGDWVQAAVTGSSQPLPAVPLVYDGYQGYCVVYDSVAQKTAESEIITLHVTTGGVNPLIVNPPDGVDDGSGSGTPGVKVTEGVWMYFRDVEPYIVGTKTDVYMVDYKTSDDLHPRWSTTSADIAAVSDDGRVTFKKAGNVGITGTLTRGNFTFSGTIQITVYNPDDPNAFAIQLPEGLLTNGVLKLWTKERLGIQIAVNSANAGSFQFSATGLPPDLSMTVDGLLQGVVAEGSEGSYDAVITVTRIGTGSTAPIAKTLDLKIQVVKEGEDLGSSGGGGCSAGLGILGLLLIPAVLPKKREG